MTDEWPTPEWKLDIPDEPVDGFRVEWFRVDSQFGIYHMHAIYSVDKPYDGLDGRGVPIVDQWMIYEKGRTQGRTSEGWDRINFQANEARFSKRFKTYSEAFAAYLDMLDAQEKAALDRLEGVRERRANLPLKFDADYSEI